MGKVDGRVALVTGAGRGIGRAVAHQLANEGALLVLNDLDPAPCQAVASEVRSAGARVVACPGSVTEDGFAETFVQSAVDAFGGVDIIVNNAGYTWDSVIQKMSDEQWDAVLDLHLKAPARILRAAQPVIRAAAQQDAATGTAAHRKVVNVSSISGLYGNPGQVNYSAAKSGIVGLTKTLAKEWGRYQVNVNAVAFGLIQTRLTETSADSKTSIDIDGRDIRVGVNPDLLDAMEKSIPLGRAGTPEEAAGAIAILTYPESDYISGQVVVCGGGFAN